MASAARYLLDALHAEGVRHAFIVPGGSIDAFLPEFEPAGIVPVVAAHEAGAAFMADGYARASGRIGLCMGLAGPGTANMMAALGSAWADRAPLLVLTGSLPLAWRGRDAFQDATPSGAHELAMVRPCTASAMEIPDPSQCGRFLRNTLRTMLASRRPVYLALPEEMQLQPHAGEPYRPVSSLPPPRPVDVSALEDAARALAGCRRIAILAGNGCVHSGAAEALHAFAVAHAIPVATTLRAKGVFPEDHPLALGVLGMGGSSRARAMLERGDLQGLLVVGARLNEYNTQWSRSFQPARVLVHVDLDSDSHHPDGYATLAVSADARAALQALAADGTLSAGLDASQPDRRAWLAQLQDVPRCEPACVGARGAALHPARAIEALRRAAPRDTVCLADSGAHTFFAGHHWESYAPREWMVATNMGPMGWALGAAVGASIARPGRPCAVVTGDGCMLMHGTELRTAVRCGLPVVYLVINNRSLASVYLRARKAFAAGAALTLLGDVDWAGFARALGAQGERVTTADELAPVLARAFAAGRPYVVDVACDADAAPPNTSAPV